MGLFSSVMHVRGVALPQLTAGLDAVMRECGYVGRGTVSVRAPGLELPDRAGGDSVAKYACGPLRGEWGTIIQTHFDEGALVLPDIAAALSKSLDTYAVSLDLHDDDVFFYQLHHRGQMLDGYDSDPMYFAEEPLTEPEIKQRRHDPKAFGPLLPPGVTLAALSALLDRGWWGAHDRGELDEDGLMTDEGYRTNIGAADRMAAFGTLLQLHGAATAYPYVDWSEAGADAWSGFTLATYARS